MKNIAIYLRVSTNSQTVENQRQELEAVASRNNWNIVKVFEDSGISGAKSKDERPAFKALHQAITRKEIDLIATWSVDRLGRSLQDLVAFLNELNSKNIDLYLHQQGLDTVTPAGRAMFQMLGIFSEFERAMIQERVKSGLARAKNQGRVGGRPKLSGEVKARIVELRRTGLSVRKIADEVKASVGAVQKVVKGT